MVELKLPNIYEGDYRLLAIPAIVLMLLSLLFITSVPAGIDLKGGMLITLQTNSTVDEANITASLEELGAKDISVSTYSTPLGGQMVEIQIAQQSNLADAEKAMRAIPAQTELLERLQVSEDQLNSALNGNYTQEEKDGFKRELRDIQQNLRTAARELNASTEIVLTNCEPFLGNITRNASMPSEYRKLAEDSLESAKEKYKSSILGVLEKSVSFNPADVSLKDVSPTLSEAFLEKAVNTVVYSAILSTIAVFLILRLFSFSEKKLQYSLIIALIAFVLIFILNVNFLLVLLIALIAILVIFGSIPSLSVLMGAAGDVLIALGFMGFFQVPLTLPSFAALLMLIGYSLDTDILLAIRLFKSKEDTPRVRAQGAMRTGFTMTSAALTSFIVLFILAKLTNISTYYQISIVAIFGLIGDLFITWGIHAVISLWYFENVLGIKGKKEASE
ncbi:MAG: hypothetical protein ABIH99_03000 [Candidatus Micrarchaeota archaeon]